MGGSSNYIYLYIYIYLYKYFWHTLSENMLPYYNPQYCPSTSEDSSLLTQPGRLPAAVQLSESK